MRISDWSSDVCSSDLQHERQRGDRHPGQPRIQHCRASERSRQYGPKFERCGAQRNPCGGHAGDRAPTATGVEARSEEHTSELQSLMRISYAVFCLKKKKNRKADYNTEERDNKTQTS